jgi:glucose/arabinose dehydrogenase
MSALKKLLILPLFALALKLSMNASGQSIDWPFITLEEVASIQGTITDISHAGDRSERLFVVERGGRIFIRKDGIVQELPFLNITNRVDSHVGERGLLGMAFAPDFKTSGEFYLDYNRIEDGATVVSRFNVTSDPNVADPESETKLLIVPGLNQNGYHTAGQIAFGPDGYLYVATGDGRPTNPANSLAQNPASLLGKLLRIDVSGTAPIYQIPSSNPFVAKAGYKPEIWALGLRNPWRFSFDRLTGGLYIADVGENLVEEVNFQPHDSTGGENYGWPLFEGNFRFKSGQSENLTFPVAAYFHLFRPSYTPAIVGGFVSRESSTNRLFGMYLYADYTAGRIWGLKYEDSIWQTAELSNVTNNIYTTFGQDEEGKIYIARGRPPTRDMQLMQIRDTPQCFPPIISPLGGKFTNEILVTVASLTPKAVIHYRRDLQPPTAADPSVESGGTLLISTPGWLNAKAFRDDLAPSTSVSGLYTLSVSLEFTPSVGLVTNGTPLTMTALPKDSVIRYTVDGTPPTDGSPLYASPITLSPNQTVQAIASKEGFAASPLKQVFYGLLLPVPITIRTWAGTGEAGSIDGNALTATFSAPQGVCVDKDGNILVTDTGNKIVRKITSERNVSTFTGTEFLEPIGICADDAGGIYVADRGQFRIYKILPDGSVSTYAGTGNNLIWNGPKEEAAFSILNYLEIDSAGNLFITDYTVVRKISPEGIVTTFSNYGDLGNAPYNGLALGTEGSLIIPVPYGIVFRLNSTGQVSTVAGGLPGHVDGPKESARMEDVVHFTRARDAVSAKSGIIYLADNSWVRQIEPDGTVRTLVPSDANFQHGLVPPFGFASGIALGKSGEIYVADTDRNAILRLDLDSDQDGIPDSEEGGTSPFVSGADDRLRDNDGDGLSNSAEYIAGTNADDAASNFRLTVQQDPIGARTLAWKTATGRKYKLQQSNDLAGWTDASQWLAGNGETMTFGLSQTGFFRVVASLR